MSFSFQPIHQEELFKRYPQAVELEKRLLSVGGEGVEWEAYEEVYLHLPQKGTFFEPDHFVVQEIEENRCYRNCSILYAQLWLSNDTRKDALTIYLGFALGQGELWCPHAWLDVGGILIETTHLRQHYFGYPLSDNLAQDFAFSLCLNSLLMDHKV